MPPDADLKKQGFKEIVTETGDSDEEPLPADTDRGYTDAVISQVKRNGKGVPAGNKKYIFKATGKFSTTNSNG